MVVGMSRCCSVFFCREGKVSLNVWDTGFQWFWLCACGWVLQCRGLISVPCRKGGGGFRMVAESAPTEMRVKSAG